MKIINLFKKLVLSHIPANMMSFSEGSILAKCKQNILY